MGWNWLPRRQRDTLQGETRRVGPRELTSRARTELAAREGGPKPLTVVYLSVDAYAATLHRAGAVEATALLGAAEQAILARMPRAGLIAALRPPDFAILLPDADAGETHDLLLEMLGSFDGHRLGRVSAGAATSVGAAVTAAHLMQQAYQALYEARLDGAEAVHQTVIDGAGSSRPWSPPDERVGGRPGSSEDPSGGSTPPASSPRPRRTG